MKIWKIALVMIAVLSIVSCEKADPFDDTDSGRNTLGFRLNGEKVEYYWQPVVPVAPVVYMESVWSRERNDTLEIFAKLEMPDALKVYGFGGTISIELPVSRLSPSAVLDNVAEIGLPYVAHQELDSLGVTHLYGQNLNISRSRVVIRSCIPDELVSGTFEFEGDAEYRDGTKRHCKISDGHFDVKWTR